jgi:hypothetical protein
MCGAGEEIRTLDIHLGKVALYQLSYSRILSWFELRLAFTTVHLYCCLEIVLLFVLLVSRACLVSRVLLVFSSLIFEKEKTPRVSLLSHNPAAEVPSAYVRFTTQFGMGWGGTTQL